MKSKTNDLWKKEISRRDMLKISGVGILGATAALSGVGSAARAIGFDFFDDDDTADNKIDFYGKHQPGIATPPPSHVYFASLSVLIHSESELRDLFKDWTPIADRLMNGEMLEGPVGNARPPADTGESSGLDASNLTLTFGAGPSLFEKLGIKHKKPDELADLPHFPGDQIDPAYSGGDLCIQACADDPQVAFHAVRNLVRAASGKVRLKWTQAGFLPARKSGKPGETPRNLFAFKDGSVNTDPSNDKEMNKVVWVRPGDSAGWLTNGTFLAVRRIQMHLETWDRTALKDQEKTFGRHRDSGAPLGKKKEFDSVDLEEKDISGNPVIPADSHMALARQAKESIFRRGYSYSDGLVAETGAYDAGLLFISFQKHPKQFIAIQNALGRADKLNEYITHRGSALFACFPGIRKGGYIGESLFASI
ncbi:iron uptake transporter deferrochelatase/peroxidase subunit [Bhargavaea ullalensis]|uniref:Deferrochelatase n=1 Tax=Bhargavaea ullalensis TaxID=1265685 RepID=A0ABV2G9R6_9BACL